MYTTHPRYENRRHAGTLLAQALVHLQPEHPVVLALPRGGVPVAYEVARTLLAPLDVLLVRKIGAPGFAELGLGAVVEGQEHQVVLNEGLVRRVHASPAYLEGEVQRQLTEIARRRQAYCGSRPPLPVQGRTVIVVDDGIATGGTMAAALKALASRDAAKLVYAVPVAARSALDGLRAAADDGICLLTPADFRSVGEYYDDFTQTGDAEVIALLQDAANAGPASGRRDGRKTRKRDRPSAGN